MNKLLAAGPAPLVLLDANIAAATYDLDRNMTWASMVYMKLAGNNEAGCPEENRIELTDDREWAEVEAEIYPGSPLIGNAQKLLSEAMDRAKAFGHYTQFFWICNPDMKLLRVAAYTSYQGGLGYTRTLMPMEDPTLNAYRRFDWNERRFYITHCDEGFTPEDLDIYEGVCSGLSDSSIAEQLDIPVSRVRYRSKQMAALAGHRNLTGMRIDYVAGTTDYTIPTLKTVVHGYCEHLVPTLPADYEGQD